MHRSMSSRETPAIAKARVLDCLAARVNRSGDPISWWASASLHPSSRTGFLGKSRARAVDVTTMAPPPSLMMQQSSRCRGSEMIRLSMTSSTVISWRIFAFGLRAACDRMATAISASCSDVVPYLCIWSCATRAYDPTVVMPYGPVQASDGLRPPLEPPVPIAFALEAATEP